MQRGLIFIPGIRLCTVDLGDEPGIKGERKMQEAFAISALCSWDRASHATGQSEQLWVARAALYQLAFCKIFWNSSAGLPALSSATYQQILAGLAWWCRASWRQQWGWLAEGWLPHLWEGVRCPLPCSYPTAFKTDICVLCVYPFLKHMLWFFIFPPFLLPLGFVLKLCQICVGIVFLSFTPKIAFNQCQLISFFNWAEVDRDVCR